MRHLGLGLVAVLLMIQLPPQRVMATPLSWVQRLRSRRRPATKATLIRRLGAQVAAPRAQNRVAATTVLTEHPSSLRLLKRQLRGFRLRLHLPWVRNNPTRLRKLMAKPLMTPERQVREFEQLSLKGQVATAKMIDFEGKPMPPSVIPRYVEAIERKGLRPGMEGDRALLVRLPGAAEQGAKDTTMRRQVFETLIKTNLQRLVAGKPLPLDRLIVPQARSLGQLMEVHETYDRLAAHAVQREVRAGRIAPSQQAQLLKRLQRVQVVPLVEDPDTVMNAHTMVEGYLKQYAKRYGGRPKQMVVFVAGSDLNRQVGPVAGQISRTVMRSRLAKLQRKVPDVDLIPWIGNGSGPMRSGVGRFPEMASLLHPGMTFTVQPDQVDQRTLKQTISAMGRATFAAKPQRMSRGEEQRLIAVGAAFADIHAALSLRNATSTVRLANLLAPLKQRGRKGTNNGLFVDKGGQLYLHSVQPQKAGGESKTGSQGKTGTYGRQLDISGYAAQIGGKYGKQRRRLERRQHAVDALWPGGLSDQRAIKGAFARYVEGQGLTTVSGLGLAIERAQRQLGNKEVGRLRPMISFLVRNDGFVLTKDRRLVRQRIQVLQPGLTPVQVERQVRRHFRDIGALERYLGQPVEQLTSARDRRRYERASRKLYNDKRFVDYMRGKDLSLTDWVKVMDHVVPLLENPSWNRIGCAPLPAEPTRRLA